MGWIRNRTCSTSVWADLSWAIRCARIAVLPGGVCRVKWNGVLIDVTETYELQRDKDVARGRDDDGNPVEVPIGQHVSMNMWELRLHF